MSVKLTAVYGMLTDPEHFEKHFLSTHIHIAETIPGLQAFEYGKVLGTFDGSPSEAFWIASLLFDSMESLQHGASSAEGAAAVADVANYATGGVTMTLSEVL